MSEYQPKPLKPISLFASFGEEGYWGLIGNIDIYLIDKEGKCYFTVLSVGDLILTMHEWELELLKKRIDFELDIRKSRTAMLQEVKSG